MSSQKGNGDMKGFKYDKFKEELNSSDSWGSYSDLFMVLSFVFLMMYVVASLRTGTKSIHERLEKQKINRENEDLRAQMKAYDTLKDQALGQESQDEQEVYKELMDKLDLLQENAKEEKNKLRAQAQENEKKERALNRYQQVVRNIINANLLAKDKLKVREEIIDKKNETIVDLNQVLKEKQTEIDTNNQEIKKINQDLARKISDLNKATKDSKITKEKAYAQIAKLKKHSQKMIEELNSENKQVQEQLNQISKELSSTQEKVVQVESQNQVLSEDLAKTEEELNASKLEFEAQVQKLQTAHAAKMQSDRKDFEARIKKANLSASQKAAQLAEFNQKARAKEEAHAKKIMNLEADLVATQNIADEKSNENKKLSQQLVNTVGDYEKKIQGLTSEHDAKMQKEKSKLEARLNAANLSAAEKAKQLSEFNRQAREKDQAFDREMSKLKGSLAEAQERADARAKLSREIGKALKAAGVDADVNPDTGDVVISFGKDFFDTGSAELKPSMVEVIKKFIPKYSEALLKDKRIAKKITSVEIVGFASPTYKNKYIDPNSLDPEDQKAAKYNLDLSFKRASSIYDQIFDTKKIKYENQKELLSLVKVSGRSFFSEGRTPSGVTPGMSQKKFCEIADCKKAQKVIIKFNMEEKNNQPQGDIE